MGADTLRSRALYDRKGALLIANVSFYYSTNRTNQLDVFVNGKKEFTGGHRAVGDWLKNLACKPARKDEHPTYAQENQATLQTHP